MEKAKDIQFHPFSAVKYSFFKICIILNQYLSVFHYFVYNKKFYFFFRESLSIKQKEIITQLL